MPIKFRCQQCRQFLGISRAQAGEIVDCPTCGRTIRVPDLDGTVKPLPQPGLKFDDARLKNALDEIALIGDGDFRKDQSDVEAVSSDISDSDDESRQHKPGVRPAVQTLDEPSAIELPPLPAPEPVAFGPLPQRDIDYGAAADDEALRDESSEQDRPWRSTAQPRDSWKQLIAAAALKEQEDWNRSDERSEADRDDSSKGGPSSAASRDDDESSSEENDGASVVSASDQESVGLGFSTWFAIVGLIVLICSAGFWIGRSTALSWSADQASSSTTGPAPAADDAVIADDSVTAGRELRAGIEGRITWKSETDRWAPDRDACVIVLPVERDGVSRVSFVGMQREDSDEDREVLRSSLRAMGGAVEFADATGRFQIELARPGEYYVLILSRSTGRPATSDDAATIETLSRYFERAEQMLGRLAYRFETIRFSGDRMVPLDAGFMSRS